MAIDSRLMQSRAMDATSLQNIAQGQKNPTGPDATRKVARQFESMFIQMMLRSMRQTHMAENTLFDESKLEQYRDMYDGQLSTKLAERGGIGLADMITRQLAPGGVIPSSNGASTYVGDTAAGGTTAASVAAPQMATAVTSAFGATSFAEAPSPAIEALATLFGGESQAPLIAPQLPAYNSSSYVGVGKQSQWNSA